MNYPMISVSLIFFAASVSVFPRSGTMLGGTRVMIFGPDIFLGSAVFCQFGNSPRVLAQPLSTNRATCVSPTYFDIGRVALTVIVGDNELRSNFLYSKYLKVEICN